MQIDLPQLKICILTMRPAPKSLNGASSTIQERDRLDISSWRLRGEPDWEGIFWCKGIFNPLHSFILQACYRKHEKHLQSEDQGGRICNFHSSSIVFFKMVPSNMSHYYILGVLIKDGAHTILTSWKFTQSLSNLCKSRLYSYLATNSTIEQNYTTSSRMTTRLCSQR